jgi:hypothetical protein
MGQITISRYVPLGCIFTVFRSAMDTLFLNHFKNRYYLPHSCIIQLFCLSRPNDTVRVQFNKDGGSFIHSDSDHDVHFTVVKISNLPLYLQ